MVSDAATQVPDLHHLAGLGSGLLSLLAHELRTPLATATSSTELVQMRIDSWDAAKRDQTLERLRSALMRIETIIENVGYVERIASGKLPRQPQPVLLSTLVHQSLETCLDGGYLDSVSVVHPEEERQVSVDPRLFRQGLNHFFRYLLAEDSSDREVRIDDGPMPAITVDVVLRRGDALDSLGDPDHQRGHFGLRFAEVIAALHGAAISVTRLDEYTIRGEIRLVAESGSEVT